MTGQSVQGTDVQALRKKLLEQNAVLELAELTSMVRSVKLPGIVMDDQQAERTGHWTGSTYGNPVDGASVHDANAEKGALSIRYALQVPDSGSYEVRVSYAFAPNRASNVPVRIQHADGEELKRVNQKKTPPIDNLFLSLGVFRFEANKPAVITIENADTDGIVGADAVQLLAK